ncbi:MAG: biosynthetic-type acetolactate synthase large subunit [Verrucomicrobiota bacterium]|nr:biosynthetic-type acetolactate synthase large subunit [Verrucomicrobiota bacterium]
MSEKKKGMINGAEAIIECLIQHGTTDIFAYPGGASMEMHQAMSKRKSELRVILPRHEQAGAFAAAGYSRITGNIGVCMATSGPGATNLLTGIADAFMDSIPLIVVTGQVPQQVIGKTAFQEIDIVGMTIPIVKHSYLLLDPNDISKVFAEAFHLANSGRPGPVLIDIPKDVQQAMVQPNYDVEIDEITKTDIPYASDDEIQRIKDAIKDAKKPCIYAGGGIIIAEATKELTEFAKSYNIPVVTSLMGVGSFPETSELSLKWLGMHGTYYANYAANEADLLLVFGARFDDRVTGNTTEFAKNAKIVHVDVDNSELNKNKPAQIPINSDIKYVLEQLNKKPVKTNCAPWHKQVQKWKKDYPLQYPKGNGIRPQFLIRKLYEMTNGEAVIVPGVGQHQMWAGMYYDYSFPRQLLTSGGLGTMGFGLPTAIGAKVASPDKLVINIDGDGSFQMNIQELGTIHAENIPIKMLILNNQHLGMVAQWEDRFYGRNRGNTVLQNERSNRPYPDFVSIAKGYEIDGEEIYKLEKLEGALQRMLADPNQAYVLDVHIEYQDHVLPMIPAGGTYKDIMVE